MFDVELDRLVLNMDRVVSKHIEKLVKSLEAIENVLLISLQEMADISSNLSDLAEIAKVKSGIVVVEKEKEELPEVVKIVEDEKTES